MPLNNNIAAVLVVATFALSACAGSESNPPPKGANLDVPVMPAKSQPIATSGPAKPLENDEGRVIESRVQLPEGEKAVGAHAPGFTLKTVSPRLGTSVQLHADKVTLVYYWATWCAPCRKIMPALNGIYTRHRSAGLDVVAISVDDEENGIADFAKEFHLQYPVAWDDGHAVTQLYRVASMPTTYLIDREGVVRFIHPGSHDGEEVVIEAEINQLL